MPFASLPWYDLAEVRPAHDRFWASIASRLAGLGIADVPSQLDRQRPYDQGWQQPDLLLGQACGLDTVLDDAPPLRVVGTPHFAFEGCRGPTYRSEVLVRSDSDATTVEDLRARRCVINNPTSHSGMNALRALVLPFQNQGRFFDGVAVSGAHENSIEMLLDGAADVAAIDCVTTGLLRRHRPSALKGLRVIAKSAPAPAPPYVTHANTDPATVDALRQAVAEAIGAPNNGLAGELGLVGFSTLDSAAYEPIAALARAADQAGYRELVP